MDALNNLLESSKEAKMRTLEYQFRSLFFTAHVFLANILILGSLTAGYESSGKVNPRFSPPALPCKLKQLLYRVIERSVVVDYQISTLANQIGTALYFYGIVHDELI